MKLLLAFALMVLVCFSQTPTNALQSDLVVLKFSWTKYRMGNNNLIRGVEDPDTLNEPMTIVRQPRRDEPQELKNRRDRQERAAELRGGELAAAQSAQKPFDIYVYRFQLKNDGPKLIKGFVLEYQSQPGVRDSPAREFLCAAKTKPNESKGLEVTSAFAPSKLVDVNSEGTKPQKASAENVVVNRIEYGDGSVWQRRDWDSSILSRDASQKAANGKCVAF
jgi:hypothetical protein